MLKTQHNYFHMICQRNVNTTQVIHFLSCFTCYSFTVQKTCHVTKTNKTVNKSPYRELKCIIKMWYLNIRHQFSSVAQLCLTLCDHSTPGLPVHHHLPEFTQTHVHRVNDAIQPSHPLASPSPPAPNPPSIRVFSNESTIGMRWPKYWSCSFSIIPSKEIPGMISFSVGGRCEALRPWQRSCGRRLDIRKGGIEPQESPWKSPSIYPHDQSLPTLLLCALTYTSDFTGGCHPPPLSEKELT